MNKSHACLLSLLLGLGAPLISSASRVPVTLIEASVESRASDISLPVADTGIITVRGCPSCSVQTFYFAKERLLMVAGRQVDLPQMIIALKKAGDTPVSVHYRRSDSAVTRIVLLMSSTQDSTK